MTAPQIAHWKALIHLHRYLKGTKMLGITFLGGEEQTKIRRKMSTSLPDAADPSASFGNVLVAFSDADWAAEMPGRRSRTEQDT